MTRPETRVEKKRVPKNRGSAAAMKSRTERLAAPVACPNPTTSDREYSPDEVEFMTAIEAYKNKTGRKFPTWCEVLAVLKGLGYSKQGRG